jgi:hypothetical protein
MGPQLKIREPYRIRWLYLCVAFSLVASLLCLALRSSHGLSAYAFLIKDKATWKIIPKATVTFTLNRDYPLLGQLTFLPNQFRQGWKNYSAKTSDGIIRMPTGYPDREKWFVLKAAGYEEGPFNMEYIVQAYRNSSASNKLSAVPILFLERISKAETNQATSKTQ